MRTLTIAGLLLAAAGLPAASQNPAHKPVPKPASKSAPTSAEASVRLHGEARAAHAFEAAREQGPLALRAFLAGFPKGADLHVHLSGAVYAESFLRYAAEDGLCVDPIRLAFTRPPCEGALIAATKVSANQELYDRLVDSFSMRSFAPTPGLSGHDQFFATFARFSGLSKTHTGQFVDEVAQRAAAQNQQYLEIMETPPFGRAIKLSQQIGMNADFAALRKALLEAGLTDDVAAGLADARDAEAKRLEIEQCSTPKAPPACQVQVRYIYQILRANSPEQVFAQTLLGFETVRASQAAAKPGQSAGFVGVNFVQPEDAYLAMRDYTLQMKMLDYLHSVYPEVPISLHAGELAPGLVPPEGLRFHIRQAVELGHALRIGHGVDIFYEDDAQGLLRELAEKHVMVEINLSSNEGILGVKGLEHPFPYYRAAHVPVALSTDDEGVSRIDLTGEYLRAAVDYKLSYRDLKELVRTGMEHNFLSGQSLWAAPDAFSAPNAACRDDAPGGLKPSAGCQAFLDQNEKAAAQWELERRFKAFEAVVQ